MVGGGARICEVLTPTFALCVYRGSLVAEENRRIVRATAFVYFTDVSSKGFHSNHFEIFSTERCTGSLTAIPHYCVKFCIQEARYQRLVFKSFHHSTHPRNFYTASSKN